MSGRLCGPGSAGPREPRRPAARPAFSFIEVLFAVMILGVGFIMLAGIFPVGISQLQSTAEETAAANVGRGAVALLSENLTEADFPPGSDADVQELPPGLWDKMRGDLINAADPRFAWVPLVRRNGEDPVVQVFVFVLRARHRSEYDAATDLSARSDPAAPGRATLQPRRVKVTFTDGGAGNPDKAELAATPGAAAAAPGAFVVIASDGLTGAEAGRVHRLGNPDESDPSGRTWQLAPGNDLRDDRENLSNAPAYLVGRQYTDPANPDAGYSGPAQDVALYSTYVRLK